MTAIRPARSTDAFALLDIVKERYPETRYAGKVGIDEALARKIFAHAAQRNGGTNDGAMFLDVAVDGDDRPTAFMLGTLSRIYLFGDRLAASDLMLLGLADCSPRALNRLLDRYLVWAFGNPRVFEVALSWADSIPGNEAIIAAYKRRGFTLYSQSFRREADNAERIAA